MKTHSYLTLTVLVLVIFACVITFSQELDKVQGTRIKQAPFRIPVSGNLEKLTSGIQYEGPSALAFDSRNRPYFLNTFKNMSKDDKRPDLAGVITTLRKGKWVQLSFKSAIQELSPDSQVKTWTQGMGSISFDADDGMYLISQTTKGCFLVYSTDFGKFFQAYKLPTKNWCGAFLETFTGHNLKQGLPAIGLLYDSNKKIGKWSKITKLSIVVPEKKDGRLVLKPVEITQKCFGISNHSGGYSSMATVGNLTHIVYAEYDPAAKGNPTWVATYDRNSHKVIARKRLFNAHPNNCDVHSTPVITVDSRGFLHILGGAHNGPFLYTRSLKPNSIKGGWTKPAPMYHDQTYATLVCDKNDVLHSVYRVQQPKLVYQSKPANATKWSKPQMLVTPPKGHRGYTGFYQQLVLDRSNTLYVSFTFTGKKQNEIYPRALIASEDQGATWKLVHTSDIIQRIIRKIK